MPFFFFLLIKLANKVISVAEGKVRQALFRPLVGLKTGLIFLSGDFGAIFTKNLQMSQSFLVASRNLV